MAEVTHSTRRAVLAGGFVAVISGELPKAAEPAQPPKVSATKDFLTRFAALDEDQKNRFVSYMRWLHDGEHGEDPRLSWPKEEQSRIRAAGLM